MYETIVKHPCRRCSHSPDDHRFDDSLLTAMDADGTPWEQRPFRCLGPNLHGCATECPDFVGTPISLIIPEGTP